MLLYVTALMTDLYMLALCVEWSQARACAERWWEEVVLTTKEMRQNFAYGHHARQEWQALSTVQDHINPLVRQGKAAYALERAAYKANRATTLIDRWTPVLNQASASPLLAKDVVDVFGSLSGKAPVDGQTMEGASNTLVLHMDGLEGLPMATNDHEYEPGYVKDQLLFHSVVLITSPVDGKSIFE
jgi:hypothetical protein